MSTVPKSVYLKAQFLLMLQFIKYSTALSDRSCASKIRPANMTHHPSLVRADNITR